LAFESEISLLTVVLQQGLHRHFGWFTSPPHMGKALPQG
jgi:hypothetical protein